ncbi:uncharacterized protein [Temnothorax nylanderi]|uniref:uncharacterized protein n=1 Tax=Temnothorax nylanderi TaxID=102681 RepID=UPI003A86A7EB
MENVPQIRCGYCGWLMASQCQNILLHECFKGYDETKHLLNIDENAVATIVQKPNETESTVHEPLSSQNFHTEFDEHLIMAVLDRPSLYNHRLNIKERSKLKKSALWEEVKNTLGGDKSIKDLQKRWKYHRDCYIRVKRKLKEYVPSGSDASSANFKCSYRFYELMKPLDDVLETNLTINTLSNEAEGSSNENTVPSEFVSIHQQSLQPSSAPIDAENTNCSEVESSISLEVSTAKTKLCV